MVIVGTTAIVIPANLKRTSLLFSNTHTTAIVYGSRRGSVSSTDFEFVLYPQTSIAFSRQTGDNPTLARHIVSDTATTTVGVNQEFA